MATTALPAPTLPDELRPPLAADDAPLEADRCLDCGGPYAPAPCVVACPAEVDVPAFVTAVARGDDDAAAATILDANLLGATCARVCPVEVLCEGACVLVHEGRRPVAIGALQRHALERGRARRAVAPPNGRRVAVIGAGPAGLAAAGELAALGYTVTVHDERAEIGGLARYAIAPYRIEREPLPQEAGMLEALGVQFRLGSAIDSPQRLRGLEASADAVVLAIGMGADAEVPLPGDDLPGVWESLRFVEALKAGIPPGVGRRVAVIGGGNTAVDVARESLRLGAEEVTLVYRRTEAEMPAYPHEVEEAREEGVRFRWLAAPARFLGDRRLTGVLCSRMELGPPDASGRRRPEPVPGADFVLPADTAVKAIGQDPRTAFLAWIDGLELDRGRIVVDSEGRTSHPRYFAAGDAVNGGATAVAAVGEAKKAVRALHAALGGPS